MGWLFMRSLEGHATPKAYLDAQYSYVQPEGRSRVLASRLVALRTYYAAVEHVAAGTGAREVWGLVCLVRYNPRDREGYVFGYKDMSESMGPVEDACPADVLDLLTPTDNTFALEWRARCRARLAARRTIQAKPAPRPGWWCSPRRSISAMDAVSPSCGRSGSRAAEAWCSRPRMAGSTASPGSRRWTTPLRRPRRPLRREVRCGTACGRRKAGRGRVRSKGARLEDFPHVPARLE